MRKFQEIWVPDLADIDYTKYLRRGLAMAPAMYFPEKRRVVVQAGGHVGIVPHFLAQYYSRVYTFEPDQHNFVCLVRNTEHLSGVYAARGILGNRRGCVKLAIHSKNTGAHSVAGYPGDVPTYRVDDLGLDCCDALFLDVEGYEMHALWGAGETIMRFKPMICVEENKHGVRMGFEPGAILEFLKPLGYKLLFNIGEDIVLGVE